MKMPIATFRRAPSRLLRQAAAFGPAIVVLVLGCIIFVNVKRVQDSGIDTARSTHILILTNRLQNLILDAETAKRGYIITGQKTYVRPYKNATDKAQYVFDSLRVLLRYRAQYQSLYQSLDTLIPRKLADLHQSLDLSRSGVWAEMPPVIQTERGDLQTWKIRHTLAAIRQAEQSIIDTREQDETRWAARALLVASIGTAIAVILALIGNMYLARYAETQTKAASMLAEQSHRLEAANQAKTQFLATMSHELRTPLNAVTGYTELMLMGVAGEINEQQSDFLNRITRSGRYLLSLINDILNYAKLESGRVEFRLEPVSVDMLLQSIETMVALQVAGHKLTYRYQPADPALMVYADPERVRQIVLNLVNNAIKFTEAGGTVTISVREDAENVYIDVTDTGCGISPDKLSSIFDPFVQVDRQLTSEGSQQGVGLGLSISRDLARQMNGDLGVESEVGRGSTFTLSIPRSYESSCETLETVDQSKQTNRIRDEAQPL